MPDTTDSIQALIEHMLPGQHLHITRHEGRYEAESWGPCVLRRHATICYGSTGMDGVAQNVKMAIDSVQDTGDATEGQLAEARMQCTADDHWRPTTPIASLDLAKGLALQNACIALAKGDTSDSQAMADIYAKLCATEK